QVQQVTGGLRDEADPFTCLGRAECARIVPTDIDGARFTGAGSLECPQQGGLPGPVAAHECYDLAGVQVEVDLAYRDRVPVADHDPTGTQRGFALLPRRGGFGYGRLCQALTQGSGSAASVPHRQWQRFPTGQTAQTYHRRGHVGVGHQPCGVAVHDTAVPGKVDEPVGVLKYPFHAVFGDQDGGAQVVDQADEGCEHVLGGGRVQGRGRLVQDEDPRMWG